MISSCSLRVLCLLTLLAFLPALLVAQVTGTITGTVRDAAGAVVPQARVTATNIETNLLRTVVTEGTGEYVIPQLVPGHYQIRVEKEGFAAFLQTDVLVQANTQVQVEATLQVRSASEQVTVSSTTSLLQTNTSTLVQVVDTQRVADLPLNGRNAKHFHATGHPIAASFEPGEDWFFDYRTRKMVQGESLAEPRWHPEGQPAPGPSGKVPHDWESRLH